MRTAPAWQWNENVQIGVDYQDLEQVRSYDARMRSLRDVDKENQAIIEAVGLQSGQVLLEIGTGTGSLARHAARLCKQVYACDISPTMLQYAETKARDAGLANVEFRLGGFLTYEHAGPAIDVVASQLALHHLPDFWKQLALRRVAEMLAPGGVFYLCDVVFPLAAVEGTGYFDALIAAMPADSREEMITHIRQEHSTLAWIMEGLLTHAGFTIRRSWSVNSLLTAYLCEKNARHECRG